MNILSKMVFLIRSEIRKFEKWVFYGIFLRKFNEFGSTTSRFIQKLPKFHAIFIQKSENLKNWLFSLQSKWILLKIFEIYSKITKNWLLRGHWSIVDHPADFLPDWWFFEIFLIFSRFWDFRSWIGNFWVVSISGIRIYFCFLGFTLVP